MSNGKLRLSDLPEPIGSQTAIDFFLRSLAEDQRELAIGIVLSGTGSHGTLGIREIKLCGGMAMVQSPESAEFDQMPRQSEPDRNLLRFTIEARGVKIACQSESLQTLDTVLAWAMRQQDSGFQQLIVRD